MARRRYIVSYDVADDKRRDRVFRLLHDNGEHMQYSVFLCELNDREFVAMKANLTLVLHHKDDQVLLIDLGLAEAEASTRIDYIGRPFVAPVRVVVV